MPAMSYIDQSEFAHHESDLFEDHNPPEARNEGAFKTKNPPSHPDQMRWPHMSDPRSPFKKTAEMILCMHGWKDETHLQPMTLIVVRLHLSCNKQKKRYKTVDISFRLDNGEYTTREDARSTPDVAAHAPFGRTARWNNSSAAESKEVSDTLAAGAAYMGSKADASRTATSGTTFERQYFDSANAHPIVSDSTGEIHGVTWYLREHELHQSGVEPVLNLALLLRTKLGGDGKGQRFKASLGVRAKINFFEDLKQDFFCRNKDEPILFNPSLPVQANGDGKAIEEAVDQNNLGQLAEQNRLAKLVGRLPGYDKPGE